MIADVQDRHYGCCFYTPVGGRSGPMKFKAECQTNEMTKKYCCIIYIYVYADMYMCVF